MYSTPSCSLHSSTNFKFDSLPYNYVNWIVVVVVNFISNINNKENNSKPEKGHSDKTIYVKTCTDCTR